MSVSRPWVALGLAACISIPGAASGENAWPAPRGHALAAAAQSAAAGRPQAPSSPALAKSIRIVPLEGEGASNDISTRTVTPPVVEVRDENDLPVEGAQVIFQLPSTGAGGTFGNNERTLMTVTNSRGQAMARGFDVNNVSGSFSIRVTATFHGLKATYIMGQTNQTRAAAPRRGRKWVWIALAGAGAAAAGATIALRQSDSPTSITASAGPVVFGPPQ